MIKTRLSHHLMFVTLVVSGVLAALFAASQNTSRAAAAGPTDDSMRCATRVSSALLGTSPSQSLLNAEAPQAQIDTLLLSQEFITRFASFINSKFNTQPGANPAQDAPFHLAKFVLEQGLPWKSLFVGPYRVEIDSADDTQAVVVTDTNGIGYFRSPEWLKRYAGNEAEGYKIVTAYRIMSNIIGLKLTAVSNTADADLSATGRQAAACRGCHYVPWYALDKVARVLTRRVGTGDEMTFAQPPASDIPQELVPGVSISSDKDLITTLVESDSFRFRQCRLAFMYLYGRAENVNEAAVFEKCMSELSAKGTIQSGIAAIAKDPSFCQ